MTRRAKGEQASVEVGTWKSSPSLFPRGSLHRANKYFVQPLRLNLPLFCLADGKGRLPLVSCETLLAASSEGRRD